MPENKRLKLFITHSHADNAFTERLYADLHAHGLSGFLDVHSLKGGDRIAEEISEGLEECDVYIPVLSLAALKSPWCREEIFGAVTLSNSPGREGRPKIVSVLIEDCHNKLPVPLKTRLYFNFAGRYDEAFKELLARGLDLGTPEVTPKVPAIPARTHAPPIVSIREGTTEYNVTKDSEKGMIVHLNFNVLNFRGRKGRAVAYFYLADGTPLKDFDEQYHTNDGHVSAGVDFSPGYDNADYNDLPIFMPYAQLHMTPGTASLTYKVTWWNMEDQVQLATSTQVPFTYNRAPVTIDKVWVDYKATQDNETGLLIHLSLELKGYLNTKCQAIAYFYYANGSPVPDVDKRFATVDGKVCAIADFTPTFDDTVYNDLHIFMPYAQLETPPGKMDLKFHVNIIKSKDKTVLATSDWVPFWYKH